MRRLPLRIARPYSLRLRLIAAVMLPLAGLLTLFGLVTCLEIRNTHEGTRERVLVGSVRTLSLALAAPQGTRGKLMPHAIHLLQRRARPVIYFSVHEGRRLIAGSPGLPPPDDFRAPFDDYVDRHPGKTFPKTYRYYELYRGYVNPADGKTVMQPAFLRWGSFGGHPAQIAVEVRRVAGFRDPLVIQVADLLEDTFAYERQRYLQVALGAAAIWLIALVLFWLAITWGLRPYSALNAQVRSANEVPPLHFRLSVPADTPREAVPLIESFNALMERTEQVTMSVRQFTANASHQMRTPLSILRVHLDVLDRFGAASPQGQAALRDIASAVDTLERLLLQLIALERTGEQPIPDDMAFDLADAAAGATGDRVHHAVQKSLDLSYEAADDAPMPVHGHPLLAAELIGNLVDNAIRYNRPGGSVVVRLTRQGDRTLVAVEDDGPGIPPEEREKVFERFYRRATDADRVGSGLGLPIVRALAERMGADVRLDSGAGGRGTCVTVDFRAAA